MKVTEMEGIVFEKFLMEPFEDYEVDNSKRYPGKFEGNPDHALAEKLYDILMGSGQDEQAGSVSENGVWYGRIGRFIVMEDDRGFFSYQEHESEESAKLEFRVIEGELYVEDPENDDEE